VRLILVVCALLAGCATPPPSKPAATPSAREMLASLTIGKSTKSDVRAALGEGTVVAFPSGHDVWVYRETPPASAELVLLFEPSGILSKTRVR
jgi:outer membrane protein assembly factor BamE (lipoprotein component of BamABCDE complex)